MSATGARRKAIKTVSSKAAAAGFALALEAEMTCMSTSLIFVMTAMRKPLNSMGKD